MPKVEINGASLAYIEQGSGAPLLLIHGDASDHRTWQVTQERLASQFRVIAYSRRYHWPNQRIAADASYSMSQQLDDLQAIVPRLAGGPAHLVGHSYGAFLALALAIRQPDLVRTLVLSEPPVLTLFVSSSPKPLELVRLLAKRPRTAAAIIRFGATGFGPAKKAARVGDMDAAIRKSGTTVLGKDAFRRLTPIRLEQVVANSFRSEFLDPGFLPLRREQLQRVRTPTLLVTGRSSPALFHRLTEALALDLPSNEEVEIDGASHLIHEDNPVAFCDAVLSFLSRHG
jgi:pimeloyl-ACP methyl ester carboxylesterase